MMSTRERLSPELSRPYGVDVRKVVVKYRYYYKCKHCGHEWADVKVVEFNV